MSESLGDQFDFRKYGSNTSAIAFLIHHITNRMATEPHVHIIALEFSKVFDFTRHSTLFDKLACHPFLDHIYALLLSFFNNRSYKKIINYCHLNCVRYQHGCGSGVRPWSTVV